MSKQLRNLIIGVIVLVVAAGAYFAVSSRKTEEEKQEQTAQNIYNDSKANIVEIEISSPSESGKFVKNGADWVIEGKENIELSQINIDRAATYVKTFAYDKEIGKGDEAEYGIDKGVTFTAVSDEGKEYTVTIGDEIMGDSGYYALVEGKIYAVSKDLGEAVKKNISDYRDRNPSYVDYSQISTMTVQRQGKDTIVIEPNPDGEIEDGLGEYILAEGFVCPMPVVTDALSENIGSPLYEITAQKFIDEPESDETYGFDKPYMQIDTKDTQGYECGIIVGNEAENGYRYAKFSGKDYVCTVSTEKTDKIYNADVFDIISKYYVNTPFTKTTSVTLTAEGTTHVFTVDSSNAKVFKDNAETSAEDFSKLYGKLASLTMDGKPQKDFGESVLTAEISYSDGTKEKIEFFGCDDNYCGAEINGEKVAVTGKKMVDEFINSVKNY